MQRLRFYEDYKQYVKLFSRDWFKTNSVQCEYYELASSQPRKDDLYGDLAPPHRSYIRHAWGHIGVLFRREGYEQQQDRFLLQAQEQVSVMFCREEITPTIGDHFVPESQKIEDVFGSGKDLVMMYTVKTVVPAYDGQFYFCDAERSKSSTDVIPAAQLTDCDCSVFT